MWRPLCVVIAVLGCAGSALAACPATPPYRLPTERPRYSLSLRVLRGLGTVTGTQAVSFTSERGTDRLVFRLWPNGPRLRPLGARLTVSRVFSGGRELPTSQPNLTTLVVRPPSALAPGDRIKVSMRWRLTVPTTIGERLERYHGFLRLGTFFPLLAWNPRVGWMLDPPSTGPAETWTSPTSDFDVRISTPHRVYVLASGQKVGRGHWRGRALRDFAVALGRYRYASGVARAPNPVVVRVGLFPGEPAPAPGAFVRRAIAALEAHARRFGPYPWRTLSLGVFPDLRGGGIEYPTIVFEGPHSLFRATAHELGHQWFYSLVGNDQARDPWLDETLATWAAGRFDGTLPLFENWFVPSAVRGHLGAPMTFWDQHPRDFFAGAYAQGVKAVGSLGDPERVDCALRTYVAANAYGIAGPDDLLAALRRFFPAAERKLASFGARF